jgi:hypothetical protein
VNLLSHLNAGTVQMTECEFFENNYNGLVLSHVQTLVRYCTFAGNSGYAIRVHSIEHQPLLRLVYQGEKDFKRAVLGFVGGPWGLLNYSEINHPQQRHRKGLFCCIPSTSQARHNR